MRKALTRAEKRFWYFVDGERIYGVPTGISGDLSSISGDLSSISGNLSSISGNLTDISGDLTDCDISTDERIIGVDISDLVQ